jgi:hypothetical protein
MTLAEASGFHGQVSCPFVFAICVAWVQSQRLRVVVDVDPDFVTQEQESIVSVIEQPVHVVV